jgi:TonB family protein
LGNRVLILLATLALQDAPPIVAVPAPRLVPTIAEMKQAPPALPEIDYAEKVRPIGEPRSWFQDSDYPPAALRDRVTGNSGVRLHIDANGVPTGCWITASAGSDELDAAACRLTWARGRFTPARDKRGRKVVGSYDTRIAWRLPARQDRLLESWVRVSRVAVDGSGRVTQCTVETRKAAETPPPKPCTLREQPSAQFIAAMRGAASGPFALISVVDQRVEGTEPAPPLVPQPGYDLAGQASYAFDVTEDGKVDNCVQTQREHGPDMLRQVCENQQPFVRAAGGKRERVRVTFTHLSTGIPPGMPVRRPN